MDIQSYSDILPVILQSFPVIWKARLVKKKVSTSRKFLKEKFGQKNKIVVMIDLPIPNTLEIVQ